MAALAPRILGHLRSAWGPLDDGELADALGAHRQSVNEVCRRLEREGVLSRQKAAGGNIVNLIRSDPSAPQARQPEALPAAGATTRLRVDDVRAALTDHLVAAGLDVIGGDARPRGTVVEAVGPDGRLVVEVSGEPAAGRGPVRQFVNTLVELVQRMSDPDATYGLALPDHPQCRGFAARLPSLVRERLRLRVYFVGRDPEGRLTVEEA